MAQEQSPSSGRDDQLRRFMLLFWSFVLYAAVFKASYAFVGHGMGVVGVIPVLFGGWLFGMRGGILCGLLNFPVTCLLCIILEVPDWGNKVVMQAAPGHVVIVLIGFVVGYIRDLNLRLRSELAARKEMDLQLTASQERFRSIAESTPDAVISADSTNRIISWNRGAEKIFGYRADEIIGRSAETLLPQRSRSGEHIRFENFNTTIARDFIGKTFEAAGKRKNGEEFFLEQSLSTWQVGGERFFTSVIRDITERRRTQKEREDLIDKLQKALADIKTLSGLVPICASCKRIRDDKGFWNQIESYISKHSQAQFSHGLCPECSRKLYPELFEDKPAESAPADPEKIA